MLQGKVFFKEGDREFVASRVTKLDGVMCAVCPGYLQAKFQCTIPQMIGLKASGKAHIVEFIEVANDNEAPHRNDDGQITNVELHRKEE
jgi:hypothetical protein